MMAHSLCINWGQVESLKADLHILIISALLIHCYVNRGIRGSLVKITICPWERKYKYIQVHASRNIRQKALFKGPKSATWIFVLKMTPPFSENSTVLVAWPVAWVHFLALPKKTAVIKMRKNDDCSFKSLCGAFISLSVRYQSTMVTGIKEFASWIFWMTQNATDREGLVCLFAREWKGLVAEFEVLVIGNLEWGRVTLEETNK